MKLLLLLIFTVYSTLITTILPPTTKPDSIKAVCVQYNIDYKTMRKQIQIESSWRRLIIGKAGEVGLLQLKPTTASDMMGYPVLVCELKDSLYNVIAGARYLRFLSRFFQALGYTGHDLDLVTYAAYNEGVGNTLHRHFKKAQAKKLCRAFKLYAEQNILPEPTTVTKAKPTKYTKKIFG